MPTETVLPDAPIVDAVADEQQSTADQSSDQSAEVTKPEGEDGEEKRLPSM